MSDLEAIVAIKAATSGPVVQSPESPAGPKHFLGNLAENFRQDVQGLNPLTMIRSLYRMAQHPGGLNPAGKEWDIGVDKNAPLPTQLAQQLRAVGNTPYALVPGFSLLGQMTSEEGRQHAATHPLNTVLGILPFIKAGGMAAAGGKVQAAGSIGEALQQGKMFTAAGRTASRGVSKPAEAMGYPQINPQLRLHDAAVKLHMDKETVRSIIRPINEAKNKAHLEALAEQKKFLDEELKNLSETDHDLLWEAAETYGPGTLEALPPHLNPILAKIRAFSQAEIEARIASGTHVLVPKGTGGAETVLVDWRSHPARLNRAVQVAQKKAALAQRNLHRALASGDSQRTARWSRAKTEAVTQLQKVRAQYQDHIEAHPPTEYGTLLQRRLIKQAKEAAIEQNRIPGGAAPPEAPGPAAPPAPAPAPPSPNGEGAGGGGGNPLGDQPVPNVHDVSSPTSIADLMGELNRRHQETVLAGEGGVVNDRRVGDRRVEDLGHPTVFERRGDGLSVDRRSGAGTGQALPEEVAPPADLVSQLFGEESAPRSPASSPRVRSPELEESLQVADRLDARDQIAQMLGGESLSNRVIDDLGNIYRLTDPGTRERASYIHELIQRERRASGQGTVEDRHAYITDEVIAIFDDQLERAHWGESRNPRDAPAPLTSSREFDWDNAEFREAREAGEPFMDDPTLERYPTDERGLSVAQEQIAFQAADDILAGGGNVPTPREMEFFLRDQYGLPDSDATRDIADLARSTALERLHPETRPTDQFSARARIQRSLDDADNETYRLEESRAELRQLDTEVVRQIVEEPGVTENYPEWQVALAREELQRRASTDWLNSQQGHAQAPDDYDRPGSIARAISDEERLDSHLENQSPEAARWADEAANEQRYEGVPTNRQEQVIEAGRNVRDELPSQFRSQSPAQRQLVDNAAGVMNSLGNIGRAGMDALQRRLETLAERNPEMRAALDQSMFEGGTVRLVGQDHHATPIVEQFGDRVAEFAKKTVNSLKRENSVLDSSNPIHARNLEQITAWNQFRDSFKQYRDFLNDQVGTPRQARLRAAREARAAERAPETPEGGVAGGAGEDPITPPSLPAPPAAPPPTGPPAPPTSGSGNGATPGPPPSAPDVFNKAGIQKAFDLIDAGKLREALGEVKFKELTDDVVKSWMDMSREGYAPILLSHVERGRTGSVHYPKPLSLTDNETAIRRMTDFTPHSHNVAVGLSGLAKERLQLVAADTYLTSMFEPLYVRNKDAVLEELTKLYKGDRARAIEVRDAKYQAWKRQDWGGQADGPEGMLVDKNALSTLEAITKGSREGIPLKGAWDKSLRIFRTSVLTGPRHVAHVVFGGSMFIAMRDPGALRFYPQGIKIARQMMKDGTIPEDMPWLARALSGQGISMEDIWRIAEGKKKANIVAKAGGDIVGAFKHVEDLAINAQRISVLLHGRARGASVEQAFELMNKTLVDLDGMAPVERVILKNVFPFYAFTKHVLKYLLTYPNDHPMAAAVLSQLAEQELADIKTGLPDKFLQLFYIGKPDKIGNQTIIEGRAFNPFRSTANSMTLAGYISALNPAITSLMKASGMNILGATPELYPDLTFDDESGTLVAKRPPLIPSVLSSYIPAFGAVDHFVGITDDIRDMKERSPASAKKALWSSLNLPFGWAEENVPGLLSRAELARFRDAQSRGSEATKTGHWGGANEYNLVPFQGQLVPPSLIQQYIESINAPEGVAPLASIPRRRTRR